jgi:hypothetical protein
VVEATGNMHREEERVPYLWITMLGLLLYCLFITLLAGDIVFDGDDWGVLNVPYWHSFPAALLAYAREYLRPIEGLYWVSMFEIFGFERVVFQFFSLMLLAASCLMMGAVLGKVFPNRPKFVLFSVLFSFFLPTVSSLTYTMFTDNSRLSLLFFWASVLAYQKWVEKNESWAGLMPPSLCYIFSFLSYEACGFLLFTLPLFLVPLHCRKNNSWPEPIFLWKLGFGMLMGFGGALCFRFLMLSGGAISHENFLPPLDLIWGYLALSPFYVIAPFTSSLPREP